MEFPYAYRKYQRELVELMQEAARGGHIAVEAGTGMGKTVCALYAAGTEATNRDKRVLYLVRTNSQQRQVILESRKLGLQTIPLQGRHNLCPFLQSDSEFRTATSEELSRACQEKKERTLRGEEGCRYYRELVHGDQQELRAWLSSAIPTMEELKTRCVSHGICPYEFVKTVLSNFKVVTAPYIYFFDPSLRHALLRWMSVPLEDLIVIVDEAHNLPEYSMQLGSARLSLASIRLAEAETERYGDPEVIEGVSIKDVCRIVRNALMELAKEYVRDEDGLLPPSAFEEYIMGAFATTSNRIKQIAQSILVQGEIVREQKSLEGKVPRSFLASLGSFLLFWFNEDGWEYIRLVTGGDNPALECFCLDPSIIAAVVSDCWSSIHMSGTLSPLEEYKDSVGLPPETVVHRFPSPFPPENRQVFVVEGFTTKYEVLAAYRDAIANIRDELGRILRTIERSTAVFFPSHDLLRQFLELRGTIGREIYLEEQGMEQSELMDVVERFRTGNAVLFGVYGGRVSEGMDFPADELEMVVLVGVPYPKPTAKLKAMVNFYDAKFARGWEYAVEAPARRKLMQAVGRIIRSETDRGVAVILDNRARRFRDAMPDMRIRQDCLGEVLNFFDCVKASPTSRAQDAPRCP